MIQCDINQSYIKAMIYTTTQGAEALAAILPAKGVGSFSVEDPDDLKYILASKDALAWDFVGVSVPETAGDASVEALVSFWLEENEEAEGLLQNIRLALLRLKSDEQYGLYGEEADFGRLWMETETVTDEWKYKYKEGFRTFSPCDGIVIAPPWEAGEQYVNRGFDADGLRIVIDPGMAFGTGSHETTAMCLARLKELIKPGDTLLDAGTGSGILAIAGAMFGAAHVYAVEYDADAAVSAAGNIAANGVAEKLSLIAGDILEPGVMPDGKQYDLITANLACPLLKQLLPVFRRVLAEGGAMILSGLLDTQEDEIRNAIEVECLRVAGIVKKGEWLMVEIRI